MDDFNLNIVQSFDGVNFCNLIQYDSLNCGGLVIDQKQINVKLLEIPEMRFRSYKKKGVLSVSFQFDPPEAYCLLDVHYRTWVCLSCQKIADFSSPYCFCGTYSKCWAPIDPKIRGLIFVKELEGFNYHQYNER